MDGKNGIVKDKDDSLGLTLSCLLTDLIDTKSAAFLSCMPCCLRTGALNVNEVCFQYFA